MKYRAEIDGLRALAVIPVILFHAGFELFSGGFVGVDIFFVISGYLITTILIDDLDNGRFNIRKFYERRARRILPALYIVCLISTLFAWLLLTPLDLLNFGNALIGVSTFLSNVVFWQSQGYFAESAELNPLLHTWSLAVEEQYYVIFPLFLLVVWRFGKNKTFWFIIVLSIISLLISEWASRHQVSANFYLAPTRAWELLFGSITAFIIQKHGMNSNNFLSLIGLTAIILAIFIYDENTPFPSVYTLVPVVGAMLLVLFADKNTITAKLLSQKIFVGIGLVSYSAYLWHQPIFAYTRTYYGNINLHLYTTYIILFSTGVLSFLSWKYVEIPFRNKHFLTNKSILILSILSLSSLSFLGYMSQQASIGIEERLAKELSTSDFIYFTNMDERKFLASRLEGELKPVDTIFIGSSRIMQVNSSMSKAPSLNLSVSGASIEDHIAFTSEAASKLEPSKVIIGADPWLLNKLNGQNRWKSISDLYSYWLNNLSKGTKAAPYFTVVPTNHVAHGNLPIAQAIYGKINLNHSATITNASIEAKAKKAYDGFHIYGEKYAYQNQESINKGFDSLLHYAMLDFELDLNAENELSMLIGWLKNQNIQVTLLLSPYHPTLYSRIIKEKSIILNMEKRYRNLAKKLGIELVGSYDPNHVGCSKTDFYDGMHPKEKCMAKIVSTIAK